MTRYRQMRRHARQARRAGMQPMMVIGSGDPLPELAAVVIARWAWRYRSELAPLGIACAVAAFGSYAHAALFSWWPLILAAVGIGGLVLAVPWWANRRRRAKVRVERTIAVWPDIASHIGLVGSEIMSATADLWGWRALLRLARGQTITDVMAKVPAIESGFGTHSNAIRVYPTPDDLANRCELRVLDRDPHAGAIPWHGPSVTSIAEPIDLGPFEDAEPCRVLFLRRHAILGGATGSGKSGGLNELLGNSPRAATWSPSSTPALST